MEFTFRSALDSPETVRALFTEYTDMLLEKEPRFADYLFNLQSFDDELNHLEKKYGAPSGRLYLAECAGETAGCVGLKKLDGENCELKRLYVREKYRSRGLGRRLTEQIIADAREIGYKAILLDTFAFLEHAISMYRSLGFYEVESYNNSPMDNLIYLRLDL